MKKHAKTILITLGLTAYVVSVSYCTNRSFQNERLDLFIQGK